MPGERTAPNEAHLPLALAAANVGSWHWDIESGGVTWSESLERIHGLAPGTFEGSLEAFKREVHPEDAATVEQAIATAFETGRLDVEYRIAVQETGLRWLAGRGMVVRNRAGEPTAMVGICMDITRERRTDESLRLLVEASEQLGASLDFEETFRQLARLIVPRFADWCVIHLAQRDQRIRRVAVVHRHREQQLVADAISETSLNDSAPIRTLVEGKSLLYPQMREEDLRAYFAHTPEGERIISLGWGSAIITPLVAREVTLGAITFVRQQGSVPYDKVDLDVAKQLTRRAALSLDNSRLYSESERVREDLEAANQVKDEFLDMVSHEMRTPLTFLQAGTSLLARRRDSLDEEDMGGLVADLESQGIQLQTMVENLLALARTGGTEALDLEPVRLDRVVKDVLAPFRQRHPRRTIAVDIGAVPLVAAHGPSMERLLRNIISNAVKYSPATEPIEIDATQLEDGRIALRVRDHGPGVPPEEMERIFERFYRSPRTSTRSPGSGIGLALCRRLARMMGGDVVAENRPDGGLDVSVVLRAYVFDE
jgi:PAS domain S-box-containing protein